MSYDQMKADDVFKDIDTAAIMMLAVSQGTKGFTEEEALVVVNWARKTIIAYTMYNRLMSGEIMVTVTDGEARFYAPNEEQQQAVKETLLTFQDMGFDLTI